MMQINLNQPVYDIIKQHPELKQLLIDIGFSPLANQAMLQTAGRMVSLRQGANKIGIPIEQIIRTLEWNGYEVKKDDKNTI